jgi:hypothetical protein
MSYQITISIDEKKLATFEALAKLIHASLIRLPPSMSDQEYSQAGWSASVNCARPFSSHTML